MSQLRDLIDGIDADLVALLRRRQDCIDRAITLKARAGIPARVPERVDDVLAKVRARAVDGGLDAALSDALWRLMIEWAIAREERVLAQKSDRGVT